MEDIINFLNSLYGLPGHMLVMLGCIMVTYILLCWKNFPNDKVPVVSILAGVLFNLLMLEEPSGPKTFWVWKLWFAKGIIIGMVIGYFAWILRDKILRKIEGKFPIFQSLIDDGKTPKGP